MSEQSKGILSLLQDKFLRILTWSERYTKTDMTYLAKGGFWLWLGQGMTFISSAILIWIFANFLPKEVYGQYRFLTATAAILALTALPGMNISLIQSTARGYLSTINKTVNTRMKWGLFGTIASLVGAIYYVVNNNLELSSLFVIISLFLPFYDTFNSYHHYLQGVKDFKRNAIFRSFQRFLVLIAVGAAILLSSNIYIIIIALFLTSTLTDLSLLKRTLKIHPPNDKTDDGALPFGKKLSFVSAVRAATQHLDKLVLWYFAGPVQVATYAIAVAPPLELTSAMSHVNRLALPKMSEQNKKQLRKALLRKVGVFLVALIPIVLLYILLSPYLFNIFFPQYIEAIPYTQILSLMILFTPVGLFVQYFYATKNMLAINTMNFVEPALLLLMYAILIPIFGIYGVIFATLSRSLGSALVLLGFFVRD